MDASLGAMLTRVTALGHDRPAVTCGDVTLTYGELDERADRVASALAATGLRPGDRMAVLARNRTEYVELLFGAARAEVVLVALNWRLAGPEIAAILADSDPSLLVLGEAQRSLVDGAAASPLDRRGSVWDGEQVVLESGYADWLGPAVPPVQTAEPEDVVLQLYSSGTTGQPKGARLTHANLAFTPRMGREFYAMDAGTVNLVPSPLFHIGGIGYALTALGQGGHTVLMADVDPEAMITAIERHRVTHAFLVPAIVAMILNSPRVGEADLSSLRRIAYGGAPMTETLLVRAIERLGCGFMAVYGMTETAGSVVCLAPEEHEPHRLRSIGRPLPWLEVALTDPATGQPVPDGEVGEIRVRSGQNTPGYWNRPDETAATLVEDGWLRTGDAAYSDAEGYLYLHDRIKDMIISGGENVYPAEVENALAGHPSIADLAVIGVPSSRWGETVKAVVVPADGASVDPAGVIAYARERLAGYKCPTSVDVVDALPRNASGKVLKKDLRAPYWADRG